MAELPRLVILISGSGSNLQAILDAVADGRITAVPALVVSNRKEAYGLVRAEEAGVPTAYFPFKPYREAGQSREAYDADLAELIRPYCPGLIILAGWMHILSAAFLSQFPSQVINLHPALPGQFAGTHAIQRAYEAYQRGEIQHTGCMVHLTIPEVDAGPVIAQAEVPILPSDSVADLEERMHQAEHELLVTAVQTVLASP
ncbi:MAG: phosphoribosylglycinamide formyltransferase [Ardenticatenaceae bacterium]|nr:phosphoribosylglycinamide formyltransferase [Anaerolineales bacterium]MCB8977667.1 phosphoribosylglycinamide formyltransferase [Ardenticatenaceae bacterium]